MTLSIEFTPVVWRKLSIALKFILIVELLTANVGTVANIKRIVTGRRTQTMESHG